MSVYASLCLSFLQIGALSFGGGYAAIPLIQQQIVSRHGWLTMETFANLITISEMTPGPIALNAATFVGLQVAGLPGAILATLSLILPSCVIVSALAYVYKRYQDLRVVQGVLRGIRPAIVAMIASAALGLLESALWPYGRTADWLQGISLAAVVLFGVALFALRKWKPNPILVIILSGAAGILLYFLGVA